MGNTSGKVTACFTGAGNVVGRRKDASVYLSEPIDDLGHSFCYVRPDPTRISSSKVFHSEETTTFRSISGASVSANTSTPLSTALLDPYSYNSSIDKASAFESSTSFSSIPLQPIPRGSVYSSGPLSNSGAVFASGPMERGFMSGPIERGFQSGPLDRGGLFSGPLEKEKGCSDQFQRSYSHGGFSFRPKFKKQTLIRRIQRALSKTHNSIVAPIKAIGSLKEQEWNEKNNELTINSEMSLESDDQNLQWAQGKAGEDRVHVVVSEEHGWVFVGIYDGFNGPDAPDYLLSSLYPAVHKELKGLLWEDEEKSESNSASSPFSSSTHSNPNINNFNSSTNLRKNRIKSSSRSKYKGAAKKWEENQKKWRCEWDLERLELERRLKEQLHQTGTTTTTINHSEVLKALSQALRKTEEAYLDLADKMLDENPELALMGSCVLVMLMKGEDVYVMNVGDSRAVLAQSAEPDLWSQDLERISEETLHDLEGYDYDYKTRSDLKAVQFTIDHATSEEQEVLRIMSEHPDDPLPMLNDRVKGSLKVTRAFGAGFLKQPKWNDALLKTFRIDYIGTSPYINCVPSLYHHKLCPRDRFLILSSDGLYEYFTNEEAVSEVELFISWSPDGDPAQHLVEELLFRAAKKNGLDFHELLEIPQGDRRRYHDDVSIIVISLEGRIWRSCV